MRLELNHTGIKDVRFGPRTQIDRGLLHIERDALVQLLGQEPLFERVEIELAHPGESCRIIHVLDVFEPRYKINGANFPGALDDFAPVDEGRTCALKNIVVVATTQQPEIARNVIDMRGPAAELSPFGRMHNVILLPHPRNGVDADEYRLAVKKAGLRTAAYLAAAAKEEMPDETLVYELPPLALNLGPEGLPRIALYFSYSLASTPDAPKGDGFLRQQHPGFLAHHCSSQRNHRWGFDVFVFGTDLLRPKSSRHS